MSEIMMKAMQIRMESLERQLKQLADENAGVRGCLTEFDKRHDADQAALAAERETVAVLAKALREHHLWHLAQDRDSSAFDFDPVEAYEESGMYERTTAALARIAAEEAQG